MTHKYEKKCWSCGSTDIVHDGRRVSCKKCGATYNKLPQPSGDTFILEDLGTGGAPRRNFISHRRPSDTLARKAARARAKASQPDP
jgi:transcription initiation factor TFIIIB Brf1 subunit/transcription initiation factor TFIIB